jgi:hypothetical protein
VTTILDPQLDRRASARCDQPRPASTR